MIRIFETLVTDDEHGQVEYVYAHAHEAKVFQSGEQYVRQVERHCLLVIDSRVRKTDDAECEEGGKIGPQGLAVTERVYPTGYYQAYQASSYCEINETRTPGIWDRLHTRHQAKLRYYARYTEP